MPSTSDSSSSTDSPPTDGPTRVVLLGHGISYSASPAMQTAGFRAAGLDWTYELLDVPPEGLPDAVQNAWLGREHLLRLNPPWDGGPVETDLLGL